jgi:transposase
MDEKDKIIAEQASKIAYLEAQLLSLQALIAKSATKTSKNSHKSPSSDLTRRNQSLREKSDKPIGGQLNHEGTTLKMSTTPDEIVTLRSDFCNNCGLSLSQNSFTLGTRRQVIDIPPIIPHVVEYQSYVTTCSCGHCQTADFPKGVENHIQYGPNIQSLAIYQSQYQFVPFQRLQDFFAKVCNLPISQGTLVNFIRKAAQKAMPAYETIQKAIPLSLFVGSDETGFKLNGKKGWFWVWQTTFLTFIVAATSRSKQVIIDTFPEGLPNSILCSDRLAAQLSTFAKGHQLCLAHLMRDLNYLIQVENYTWAIDFKILLKEAIQLKQKQDSYPVNDPKCIAIEQKLTDLLSDEQLQLLIEQQQHYKLTLTFFRAMLKLRQGILPFLYHKEIPFDNNSSERAIRMIKVKTKISGQFKSLHKEFAIIRSVIDTTIKNGKSPFEAIHAIVVS